MIDVHVMTIICHTSYEDLNNSVVDKRTSGVRIRLRFVTVSTPRKQGVTRFLLQALDSFPSRVIGESVIGRGVLDEVIFLKVCELLTRFTRKLPPLTRCSITTHKSADRMRFMPVHRSISTL